MCMYDADVTRLLGFEGQPSASDIDALTRLSSLGYHRPLAQQVLTDAGVRPVRVLDLACGVGSGLIHMVTSFDASGVESRHLQASVG